MNNNSSKQVLLSVIGVAILVVAVVGVSFAFFNYSRTGKEINGITTGTVYFTANTSQVMLANAFPVTTTYAEGVNVAGDPDVAVVTLTFSGYTTHEEGIDFTVTAIGDASNTIGSGIVTTIVDAPKVATGDLTITTSATTLNEGVNAETVLCAGNIKGGTQAAPINGTITIKLFVDSTKVLITDTADDPGTVTTGKKVVTTADWNKKVFAFRINVVATAVNPGQTAGA